MKKKKSNQNELSNQIFELGIAIALAPLNFLLRNLPYMFAISTSILSIIVWCMPVITIFSVISNLIFAVEIGIKLLRK